MPLENHPTDPEKYIYKSQEYNLNQISEPSTISFYKEINQSWVMRITADKRIEVAEGVDVTEAARQVLDAMEGMLDVGLERAVLAEREACAKLVEGLPAPDEYSITDKSMWDVTCIDCAEAIRARGQA
jgi:hypothetical protein